MQDTVNQEVLLGTCNKIDKIGSNYNGTVPIEVTVVRNLNTVWGTILSSLVISGFTPHFLKS